MDTRIRLMRVVDQWLAGNITAIQAVRQITDLMCAHNEAVGIAERHV